MLEEAIRQYNNRTIETTQVIEELIKRAKGMNAAVKRGEDLGLIKEEVAFYDALSSNESAKEIMGDLVLKQSHTSLHRRLRAILMLIGLYVRKFGRKCGSPLKGY